MAEPTIGGQTSDELINRIIQAVYASGMAAASLNDEVVSEESRQWFKAGIAAGATAMFKGLVAAGKQLIDEDPLPDLSHLNSRCTCPLIDVSKFGQPPRTEMARGYPDPACPLHKGR